MSDREHSSEPPKRGHRVLAPILLVLASLALFTGAFAVWVNRQALNTGNWRATSSELLAASAGPAPPPSQAIADLERLVALHDSGQLSDMEFATAKTQVMNGS